MTAAWTPPTEYRRGPLVFIRSNDGYGFEEGEPCPSCDLPATTSLEILTARKRGADQKLVERLAELSKALLVAERRAVTAERRLENVKYALGETT